MRSCFIPCQESLFLASEGSSKAISWSERNARHLRRAGVACRQYIKLRRQFKLRASQYLHMTSRHVRARVRAVTSEARTDASPHKYAIFSIDIDARWLRLIKRKCSCILNVQLQFPNAVKCYLNVLTLLLVKLQNFYFKKITLQKHSNMTLFEN